MTRIILIGYMGAGKTTIGKVLAREMGMEFYDLDNYIEDRFHQKIPDIFAEQGEAAFRDAETAACEELGKRLGAVIATGGGAVVREQNRNALRQNGTVVYLRRGLDALARSGRPLSKDRDAVKAIFEQRKDIYERFADFTVDVNDDAQVTTERVISCISL